MELQRFFPEQKVVVAAREEAMTESCSRDPSKPLTFACIDDIPNKTPLEFVDALKSAYINGEGKAGAKFQALSRWVSRSLEAAPQPGPATFVVHCLRALLTTDPQFRQGLSLLVTRSLRALDHTFKTDEDTFLSNKLAAALFKEVICGQVNMDEKVLVRLAIVFGIKVKDIADCCDAQVLDKADKHNETKCLLESFILDLVKMRSYNSAVSLLEQFDMQDFTSQEFLIKMVSDNQAELAGQWAAYLGTETCCFLVQQCMDMGLFKVAYKIVERYKLHKEFPDAYYLNRVRSVKKLVHKGLWEIAEEIAQKDRQLQEYVVRLALEMGDLSRAEALCSSFVLDNFHLTPGVQVVETIIEQQIQLSSIISLDKVIWIDDSRGLNFMAKQLGVTNVLGFDCEWKADRVKGQTPNKVSTLQLATKQYVFVLDLPSLAQREADLLEDCVGSAFRSSSVLKLGYAVKNDLYRLAQSYGALECFHYCAPLLDLQKIAGKEVRGGLSGLAKATMGCCLDKSSRMTNWEQRPLSYEQLNYAALDAVVLLHIHDHLCNTKPLTDLGQSEAEIWKFQRAPDRRCPRRRSGRWRQSFKKSGANTNDIEKNLMVESSHPLSIQQSALSRDTYQKLLSLVPFVAFRDTHPKPAIVVNYNDVEELAAKASMLSSRHLEMFGRYISQKIPKNSKDKFFFCPPTLYMEFKMHDPKDTKSSLQNILTKAVKGLNLGKCQFILLPVIDANHWSLLIIGGVCANAPKVRVFTTPGIILLNSLEDIKPDVAVIKEIYSQLLTWIATESNSLAGLKRNKDKFKIQWAKVPKQKDDWSCGLYVMACMDLFVSYFAEGKKKTFFSSEWFDQDFAFDRREVLSKALLQEALNGSVQ